jgi:plastocyanin
MDQQESSENKEAMFGSKLNEKNSIFRALVGLMILVATIITVVWLVVYVTSDSSKSVDTIASEVALVEITNDGFMPGAISVKAGQQVKFINRDAKPHRIMADPESLEEFDSMNQLATGDSYTYVFDTPGTYYYYDNVNAEVYTGSVEVRQ